jgi:hypothetical protein
MKRIDDTKVRRINAVLAAALACFFLVHALLGVLSQRQLVSNTLAVFAWAGVVILAVHIACSVGTTWYMYTDTLRPPSNRKKQHQVLKWVTGVAVLALALYHMLAHGGSTSGNDYVQLTILLVLLVFIAIHSYTGVKSLTRDLAIDKRARMPIRVGLIGVAVAIGLLACVLHWL